MLAKCSFKDAEAVFCGDYRCLKDIRRSPAETDVMFARLSNFGYQNKL